MKLGRLPSPSMGEGYGGLALQGPSRSWMGVRFRRSDTPRRPITPIQAPLARFARKLRYPSPIKGEEGPPLSEKQLSYRPRNSVYPAG